MNRFILRVLIFGLLFVCIGFIIFGSVSHGSDEGRIWHTSKVSITSGPEYALNSLMPLLTTYYYSIFLSFFGYEFNLNFLNFPIAIISILLIYLIMIKIGITKKISLLSIFFLLSSFLFFQGIIDVRPYLLANFFVLMSINFFLNYLKNGDKKHFILSAIFLSFTVFIQNMFIVALIFPGIFYILSSILSKSIKFKNIFYYYLIILIIISPWLIYRFSLAGFDFYKAPLTWIHSEGYWAQFNLEFYSRPQPLSFDYYLYFFKNFYNALPIIFIFSLPFTFIGKIEKYKILILSWLLAFVFPFMLGKVPAESRYLYPLLISSVVFSSIGLFNLYEKINKKTPKNFVILIFVLVILFSLLSFSTIINKLSEDNKRKTESINDIIIFKDNIEKNTSIYSRSHLITPYIPNNHVYSITDLKLEDAISLISWVSEEDVEKVFKKYEITYVILYKSLYWERDFHAWLTLATNKEPMHYIKIDGSKCFVKLQESNRYKLYKFICK